MDRRKGKRLGRSPLITGVIALVVLLGGVAGVFLCRLCSCLFLPTRENHDRGRQVEGISRSLFSPTLPEALKVPCQEVLAQSLKARRGNNEERSFHLAFGRKSLDRLQWSACNIVPN